MKENVQKELVLAMKAHDAVRLGTMRMLLSALEYDRIAKMRDLTSDEELQVVRREAKKRSDAIEIYKKAGDTSRLELETRELEVLSEFLPKALSEDELKALIQNEVSGGSQDFGAIMKAVMAKAPGVDGKLVSTLVRNALS